MELAYEVATGDPDGAARAACNVNRARVKTLVRGRLSSGQSKAGVMKQPTTKRENKKLAR